MSANFDYQGALDEGYTPEEIKEYLSSIPQYKKPPGTFLGNVKENFGNFIRNFGNPTGRKQQQAPIIDPKLLKYAPDFDLEGAINEGYSPEEISEYLESQKPKRGMAEKSARVGAQFGLGVLQGTPAGMAYEAAVSPLASKEAQSVVQRQNIMEDIERLMEQKQTGVWDQKDQELLDHLQEQIKHPEKAEQFVKTTDISLRGLAEQATGVDLEPEGILEKGAQWAGFIKNPKKLSELGKVGLKPKDVIKAIAPSGGELLRGASAGAALELAEQGNFGPVGTMAAAVVGDLLGGGVGAAVKGAKELITAPKETLAKAAAKFTPKDQVKLQKEIIQDFRNSGIQADLGTLTDSNLVKWTQARLAQSGLAGKSLDEFKETLTNQIRNEYKELAHDLGELKFATTHEAGVALQDATKAIRDADLAVARNLYKETEKSLSKDAFVQSKRLANAITNIEKQLKPGSLKSTEQLAVLNVLGKLKGDIIDSKGTLLQANVKELMNNKIALNDIINYEVQGGTKQLLKGIVSEIDRAILQHGKDNPTFAKNYVNANKKFSEHAKTFRNKTINNLMNAEDPAMIMNKMNTVQGMRNIGKILNKSPQGKALFNRLKATKLEDVVGKNLVDSSTQQVKLGTFSKLLEKGKNAEIVKELLGNAAFKRLERLQKNAGKLADAVNKFYNASKSGVVAADAAVLVQGMSGIANLLVGNPWPLMKVTGGIMGARKLGSLLSDPEFLRLTEEAILASEKGSQKELVNAFLRLKPYVAQALQSNNQSQEEGQRSLPTNLNE
jgi:hypothetical protein